MNRNRSHQRLHLPEEVLETMFRCAFRIDGWAWLESKHEGQFTIHPAIFRPYIDPICDGLRLYDDENANFAAFFILQRYLYKDGDYTSYDRREHTAFRFLFLHLYQQPTPSRFGHENPLWDAIPITVRHRHAAIVREKLLDSRLRRGRATFGDPND